MRRQPGAQDLGEQLTLFGKVHLLLLRAIAQEEQVVDPADGVERSAVGRQGAKRGKDGQRRTSGKKRVRRGTPAQTGERHAAAQRLELDVPARPPAPDQLQLANRAPNSLGWTSQTMALACPMILPALWSRLLVRK